MPVSRWKTVWCFPSPEKQPFTGGLQLHGFESLPYNAEKTNHERGWSFLETNPNFNTNAPPFEVRGCKVILGGAFLGQGGAKNFEFIKPFKLISICYWDY